MNGYLVNAKSSEEIADRLLILLQNDEMREEIAAKNREKAKLYTWDKIADIVEKIYSECFCRTNLIYK